MKRMPFGIKTAAAIFQKTMENILSGIPNGVCYKDDITVTGKNFAEHIETLKIVLKKTTELWFKIKRRKMRILPNKNIIFRLHN